MSHTPGPWKYGVRNDDYRSMWLSLGDFRTGAHYQGDLVASESDAKLICAAPELLDACRLVNLMFKRKSGSHLDADWLGDDEHEAWSAVLNAITKAEGRA